MQATRRGQRATGAGGSPPHGTPGMVEVTWFLFIIASLVLIVTPGQDMVLVGLGARLALERRAYGPLTPPVRERRRAGFAPRRPPGMSSVMRQQGLSLA